MKKDRLLGLSLATILICSIRDLIGASIFSVSPEMSYGTMRIFDLFYFYYFVHTLLLFYPSPAFSRLQKGALTLTLVLFIVAFARTQDISILVRSLRETVCPIAFLIAGGMIAKENPLALLSRNRLVQLLVITLLVSIAVGIKQMLTVDVLSDYWFYDYMTKNNIEIADAFNFIRNGLSRGTGLGFSPFSLGYFGLGMGIFGLVLLRLEDRLGYRSGPRIWRILPIACGLVACILSDSRLATASLGGLILLWWSRLSPKLIALTTVIVIYLFGVAFVEYLQDPSFNARFLQWGLRIEDGIFMNLFGSTMASGPKDGWVDSFILNFINNFGTLALVSYLVFVLSFAKGYAQRVTVFALTSLILVHTIVQALEYNVFLPLAFLSLGVLYGINRDLPTQSPRREIAI